MSGGTKGEKKRDWILDLLYRARDGRVISAEEFEVLDEVRQIGNKAAHGRVVEKSEAKSALMNLRVALERMYR